MSRNVAREWWEWAFDVWLGIHYGWWPSLHDLEMRAALVASVPRDSLVHSR